ncbi:probable cytochrome P450 49a1 [Ostrea edulis]|uniref:probable cytochrome P450 49a1 n=1 Tax=Ostrea edulis TaxID=37623 RepID=UPI0024AEC21D|nr:probable cytochrome P450 49a1 [Ostrea edulis]
MSSSCHVSDQGVKNSKPFSAIPGPSGRYSIPYLGQALHFQPFGRYLPSTFTDYLRGLRHQYGPVVRQRAGMQWMVFLFNPDDIQRVLFQYEKYPIRPTSHLMHAYSKRRNIPLSMAFQNKAKWVKARKPVQELILKPNAVPRYFSELMDIAEDFMVKRIEGSNQLGDTLQELTRLTMENSAMFCFNTRLDSFSHDHHELLSNILDVHDYLGQSFIRLPWYRLFPTRFYLEFEKAYDNVRHTAQQSLSEYLERKSKQQKISFQDFTFLEKLVSDPRMPRDSVESAITDMFIAGTDVTANTLSFVLYHLAKNPLVQDRLYDEIKQCCVHGEITASTLANMPYLKACIKESLRLVPPLRDGIRRYVEKDTVVAGYDIPRGTTLVFCNSVISNDKAYFPEPLAYKPERWLRSSPLRSNFHPFAILPYGFGRRNCVGQRFADLQMHILIVKLLQKYSLRLPVADGELPYTYTIFATPSRKFSVLLDKRVKKKDERRCEAEGQ